MSNGRGGRRRERDGQAIRGGALRWGFLRRRVSSFPWKHLECLGGDHRAHPHQHGQDPLPDALPYPRACAAARREMHPGQETHRLQRGGGVKPQTLFHRPTGPAVEYARLALRGPYVGCTGACAYCYNPKLHRRTMAQWVKAWPMKNFLKRLEDAALALMGDPRRVFMSFGCDPCQPCEEVHGLTAEALERLAFLPPEPPPADQVRPPGGAALRCPATRPARPAFGRP